MKYIDKKQILIISPHFLPENFKCNDVAFELSERGYKVTVLSDIPNYPGGKFFKGYGVFHKRREVIRGVKIYRTLMTPRGDGSGKMLALNYITFALTSSLRVLWWCISRIWDKSKRFDVVLVHETSPITVGIPAVIVRVLQRKSRLLFWVLDLWSESMQVAGGINNRTILNIFDGLAKWIYRHSDKILVSSKGFKESICKKGDFCHKLEYFPNWAEEAMTASEDYILPKLPTGFKVMFAGNIGEAQDFEHILDAFCRIADSHPDIHLVLVGDGRKRMWVENYLKKYHLERTVHCVGYHPLGAMGKFFSKADVLFFALKDSLIFNLTCPAKLQAYMYAGKPIVAMLNGEGASIVKEAECGLTVPAGDSETLARVIVQMSDMSKQQLTCMGENGRRYCKENFSFERNMDNLEKWIM